MPQPADDWLQPWLALVNGRIVAELEDCTCLGGVLALHGHPDDVLDDILVRRVSAAALTELESSAVVSVRDNGHTEVEADTLTALIHAR